MRAGSAACLPSQQASTGLPAMSPSGASRATASAASVGEASAVGQFIISSASTPGSAATARIAAS